MLPGLRRALCCAVLGVLLAGHAASQHVTLTLDDLNGPGFSARGIRIALAGADERALAVEIATVSFASQQWKNVRLLCPRLRMERYLIECRVGELLAGEKIPLTFSYATDTRALRIALMPAAGESWSLATRPGKRGDDAEITIDGGRLQRLVSWLPAGFPALSAGTVKGVVRYGATGTVSAQLVVAGLAFSDKQGLHAGEKIGFNVDAQAERRGEQWQWNTRLAWTGGEAFWQPLYLKAGNQVLAAQGSYEPNELRVESGTLHYPGLGEASFSARYDNVARKLAQASVRTGTIKAQALYETVLKPYLAQTSFADLRTDGEMALSAELGPQGPRAVDVKLDNFSFEDRTGKFALFQASGSVPWRADEQTVTDISIKGGELLRMQVGAFALPLVMNGMRFELKSLRVPLLDGNLEVRNFVARGGRETWYWQFGGELGAISMDRFTQALGLPVMHGTLAATIPMVRHVRSSLRVDGALFFKVFDGSIEASNLVLLDIFGKAPRVQADVSMRNLDLDLVTRAFSFGGITGRIDARIGGLELVNWQPVAFDAVVESSAGEYPRKISQAAVQNISALGGAGAAAAIQRSFLRFFEQFGYRKLGLKCKLSNGVCQMDGIEAAPQGYVIVKGGGIPAISVIGYNRNVDWQELVQRLKRITQENVKPIVE